MDPIEDGDARGQTVQEEKWARDRAIVLEEEEEDGVGDGDPGDEDRVPNSWDGIDGDLSGHAGGELDEE